MTTVVFSHDNLTMMLNTTTARKSTTHAIPPPAPRSHPLDVLCGCRPCRQYRVAKVDAFCEGLIAGIAAAPDALEGPPFTGTMSGSPSMVCGPSRPTRELTPTRRPPGR